MPLSFEFLAASPAIFALPHDIDLSDDGRQLLVADVGHHRIAVLDAASLQLSGEFGGGELGSPHDVVLDADGLALVADTDNNRIVALRWTTGGSSVVYSLADPLRRPEGVAVGADGAVFASGAASHNLVKFVDGRPAKVAEGFSSPHDVVLDGDGSIWVADAGNDRIVKLDQELNTLFVLADPEFRGPRYLAFDPAGLLYVADKYSHNLKIFSPYGERVAVLGSGQAGEGQGVFRTPEGVVLQADEVWISDTGNHRIVRYRVSGQADA